MLATLKRYPTRILAGLAIVLYAAQTFVYIFTSRSMLDEGLYLLKGWYFATGQYVPFEDYGVLTNHMPLAFLIPGYVLKWFGASLLVGRLYAAILGVAALILLGLVARRLGGEKAAAFAILAVSLDVALVRIYSLALSQVLVATLLSAALCLSLGREVRTWQLLLAGLACGALFMVRINMLPLLGLWLLYLAWQHGWRATAFGAAGILLVVVPVHVLYWPNILRLWAYWIPQGMVPGLQPFYTPWDKFTGIEIPANWEWLRDLDHIFWNPIISFWQGVRFNFIPIIGVVLNLVLWPKRKTWPDVFLFKLAIFLNLAFVVLLGVHMWAALGGQSCHEFCFSGYIAFFYPLGLLAVAVTAPHWRREFHWLHTVLLALLVMFLGAGIAFGAADVLGKPLAELPIPRSSGSFPLWGLFENKFGIDYRSARKIIPTLVGAAIGLAIIVAAWLYTRRSKGKPGASTGATALLALFLVGSTLTPTPLFSLGDRTLQCGGNLPRAYDELAAQLGPLVSAGDRLYYAGPNSPAILLYLPGVKIYPPQLNNVFSFSTQQDQLAGTDALLRFGYWNQELKDRWISEADLILIEARRYAEWEPYVISGHLDTLLVTGPVEPCRGKDSAVVLFKVNKQMKEALAASFICLSC